MFLFCYFFILVAIWFYLFHKPPENENITEKHIKTSLIFFPSTFSLSRFIKNFPTLTFRITNFFFFSFIFSCIFTKLSRIGRLGTIYIMMIYNVFEGKLIVTFYNIPIQRNFCFVF